MRSTTWNKNPLYTGASNVIRSQIENVREEVEKRGCEVNVCFAIDGSGSINSKDFTIELNFVNLVASIISTDRKINFCGVQYSETTTAISPLTDDRLGFLGKVANTKQDFGRTNLPAALGYAIVQLFPFPNDANKIIVLGDGLSNIGFAPAFVAGTFIDAGGSISAVAVGGSNVEELALVTQDSAKVFYVEQFAQLVLELQNVVRQACGFNLSG